MAQKRKPVKRRRSTLEPKYFMRRMALVILPAVAVVGVAVWLLVRNLSGTPEQEVPAVPSSSQESSQASPSSTPPESSSQPEPEPEPEVSTSDWNLLLVNSATPLPEGYEDTLELETITDHYQVDKRIADSVRKMFTKAKEDGINLMICSAYRTVEKQTELFENQKQGHINEGMNEEEAVAAALTLVTRPGFSEHHTGLALDIVTPTYQNLDEGFAETAAFGWLDQNAAEYGFILRYPKNKESVTQINYEPWHYRYVGVEYAKAIKESGYCLEEFLWVTMKDQAARIAEMEKDMILLDPDEPSDP